LAISDRLDLLSSRDGAALGWPGPRSFVYRNHLPYGEEMLRCSTCVVLLALCPIVFAAGGCSRGGPRLYPVTGSVNFDGKPVEEGDIIFSAVDGSRSAGGKIEGGTYTLEATAGKYKVQILAMRDIPGEIREDNPGEKIQAREQYIPAQYNTETTLEANVEPGSKDDIDFDLKP
jgi:hypothetical protein